MVNYLLCSRCFLGFHKDSILGPLLYLLYTAELALVVAHHGLNLHQYADDTQFYVSTSVMLRQPSHISLCISSTLRLG